MTVNYNGVELREVDVPDIIDCTEPATVAFGRPAACDRHVGELEAALRADHPARRLDVQGYPAEPGRVCGEHLRPVPTVAMADCAATATVSLGDGFACEAHRPLLVTADRSGHLLLHIAGTGRICGEHLRPAGEVAPA